MDQAHQDRRYRHSIPGGFSVDIMHCKKNDMHLGANSTPYKSSFSPLWGFCVSLFCLYNIGYDTSFSGTETASA